MCFAPRRSPHAFTSIGAMSPKVWLARGYAVLDGPALPIVGGAGDDGAEPNDTYVAQLVAGAKAAVDALVARGVTQRGRVAVGGSSYGAFSALLCSGAVGLVIRQSVLTRRCVMCRSDRQPALPRAGAVRVRRRAERRVQPHAHPLRLPSGGAHAVAGAQRVCGQCVAMRQPGE